MGHMVTRDESVEFYSLTFSHIWYSVMKWWIATFDKSVAAVVFGGGELLLLLLCLAVGNCQVVWSNDLVVSFLNQALSLSACVSPFLAIHIPFISYCPQFSFFLSSTIWSVFFRLKESKGNFQFSSFFIYFVPIWLPEEVSRLTI